MAAKKARKPSAAFMKPMTPSDMLAEVIGSKPLPRTQVTKKMWEYIKKNKLQDPKKRTMINADDLENFWKCHTGLASDGGDWVSFARHHGRDIEKNGVVGGAWLEHATLGL